MCQDPDLERLRERREWLDALDVLKGGVTSSGVVKLRTEARAPFRLTRLIFTGGFTLSAIVGVVLLAPRFLTAAKGVHDVSIDDNVCSALAEYHLLENWKAKFQADVGSPLTCMPSGTKKCHALQEASARQTSQSS